MQGTARRSRHPPADRTGQGVSCRASRGPTARPPSPFGIVVLLCCSRERVVRSAAAPGVAAVEANGPHRILVIFRRAAWDDTTSRLLNSESAKVSWPSNVG